MLQSSAQGFGYPSEPGGVPARPSGRVTRAGGSARALLLVIATCFGGLAPLHAQILPNWYYETIYVGSGPTPWANEVAVMSAWSWSTGGTGVERPSGGLFADFNTAAAPANAIHAAALDSSAAGAVPGAFAPTGSLAVAKNLGGINGFETYFNTAGIPSGVNPTDPGNFGSQEMVTGTMGSFLTPSASGNPIQAMDIANGFQGNLALPLVTSYVATAEVVAGNIWLGVYGMTNALGVPVQPYFVNATNTNTQPPCQGLVTSNGKPGLNGLTKNDIVFVDGLNRAHAQWFEIGTAAFPAALDVGTNFPAVAPGGLPIGAQLPAGTIAGVWICQAPPPVVNAHNVGISIAGPGGAGTHSFNILHDMATPAPTPPNPPNTFFTSVSPFGGGPLCHIPSGGFMPGRSPAAWALGSTAGSGAVPTGWFVANEAIAGVWTLEAVDANGGRPGTFVFPYSAGFVPNGTPLTDPTATGFAPVPPPADWYQAGLVWVPELDTVPGGIPRIHLVSGAVIAPAAPTPLPAPVATATFLHQVAAANHPSAPPLPALPLAGTPWPGTILPDQKTNSKADYGLFLPGY